SPPTTIALTITRAALSFNKLNLVVEEVTPISPQSYESVAQAGDAGCGAPELREQGRQQDGVQTAAGPAFNHRLNILVSSRGQILRPLKLSLLKLRTLIGDFLCAASPHFITPPALCWSTMTKTYSIAYP